MVAGPAAADAVARARRLPGLRVGLHLVAVEGPSVLRDRAITGHDGWFGSEQFSPGVRYAFSSSTRKKLDAEIAAQFDAFAATGLPLSHADAHKHMHLHPTVAALMLRHGRAHGLRRVRVPSEPPAIMAALGSPPTMAARALHQWTGVLRVQCNRAGMATPEAVFGLAWSGHMTEDRVRRILDAKPRGDVELYFHPAAGRDALLDRLMPDYEHEAELEALLSPAVARRVSDYAAAG